MFLKIVKEKDFILYNKKTKKKERGERSFLYIDEFICSGRGSSIKHIILSFLKTLISYIGDMNSL